MHEDHEKARRDWRIPDELWERIVAAAPAAQTAPPGVPSAPCR